jgi:hypothetical protein
MLKKRDNRGISKITLFVLVLLIVLIFVAYFVVKKYIPPDLHESNQIIRLNIVEEKVKEYYFLVV